ncbi:hypothetical protein BCF11_5270 [Collimonas sp. PA-H2]|nr:hypothetical protein BCF11_5270 [Collimonas sp. PA-H2]
MLTAGGNLPLTPLEISGGTALGGLAGGLVGAAAGNQLGNFVDSASGLLNDLSNSLFGPSGVNGKPISAPQGSTVISGAPNPAPQAGGPIFTPNTGPQASGPLFNPGDQSGGGNNVLVNPQVQPQGSTVIFNSGNSDSGANAANSIPAPPNTHTVYPLGPGAANGPLPPGYVTVSRWVSPAEAALWVQNQGTAIPSAVPQNGTPQVYVTTAGAAYPPGANGTIRIDFAVPGAMLQPGNASNNFQILQPSSSTPTYNVKINVPNGVVLPKAK